MYRLVEDRREVVAEMCRRYGVERLDLFGSAAKG
jgi:predicted nucleotidyltransferase